MRFLISGIKRLVGIICPPSKRKPEEKDIVFVGGPSLEFVYSETKRVFDLQHDEIDKLDSKTGLLLGAAGVVLAVLFQSGLTRDGMSCAAVVLLSVSVASVALSAVSAVGALWVRTLWQVPGPRELAENCLDKDEESAKVAVLNNFIRYYYETMNAVECKANLSNCAGLLLTLGIVLIAVAFVVEVF